MRWKLSDGTVVTSDGKTISVQGSTDFAKYLAHRAAEGEVRVPVEPPPDGTRPLDPSNASNIDAWLEYEIWVTSKNLLVSERPDITPSAPEPADDDDEAEPLPQGMQRVY